MTWRRIWKTKNEISEVTIFHDISMNAEHASTWLHALLCSIMNAILILFVTVLRSLDMMGAGGNKAVAEICKERD